MSQDLSLPDEDQFSDDPEENLRMHNDFLKMKLMAETGASFGGDGNIPPELENVFLKNIIEFEKGYANSKLKKVSELLDNPRFVDEEKLSDEQLESEYERLEALLKRKNIQVSFDSDRTNRFKYHFITKELFKVESDSVVMEGMITHFSYEEFHPDHEKDLWKCTEDFLDDFLNKDLTADSYYIDDHFIVPDGTILTREQLMNQIHSMYDAVSFENSSYNIDKVQVDPQAQGDVEAMGFSEGEIDYDLIFKGGERKEIRGYFKVYFTLNWGAWTISFFYLSGFNMAGKAK